MNHMDVRQAVVDACTFQQTTFMANPFFSNWILLCWNMIYTASAGAVAQNAVGYASGLHLTLKSYTGGPLFRTLPSGPFCPAANARQRPRHAKRSEKKGGLLLCPARLAWQFYLTRPKSTRRQSPCHHAMYPGQRVPPNAPSLQEQRSCTGASWLMLRIQPILIPSHMQGHAVVVGVTVAVAVAVAVGVAVAVAVVVAVMQQAVPSPLAVPMWRQPLLLHQLRKNFAGQERAQANAQLGHCLPPPLMLMQNPVLPQYPISSVRGVFFRQTRRRHLNKRARNSVECDVREGGLTGLIGGWGVGLEVGVSSVSQPQDRGLVIGHAWPW